jgi:hypothetical protein
VHINFIWKLAFTCIQHYEHYILVWGSFLHKGSSWKCVGDRQTDLQHCYHLNKLQSASNVAASLFLWKCWPYTQTSLCKMNLVIAIKYRSLIMLVTYHKWYWHDIQNTKKKHRIKIVLMGKPERNKCLWQPWRIWEINMKINHTGTGCEDIVVLNSLRTKSTSRHLWAL